MYLYYINFAERNSAAAMNGGEGRKNILKGAA
jgi:hypothetical protein